MALRPQSLPPVPEATAAAMHVRTPFLSSIRLCDETSSYPICMTPSTVKHLLRYKLRHYATYDAEKSVASSTDPHIMGLPTMDQASREDSHPCLT
jgi:hypothetical protein